MGDGYVFMILYSKFPNPKSANKTTYCTIRRAPVGVATYLYRPMIPFREVRWDRWMEPSMPAIFGKTPDVIIFFPPAIILCKSRI